MSDEKKLPTSARALALGEQLLVIEMDEETKQRLLHACDEVIAVLRRQLNNAAEAHAVLSMCREALSESCGIRETVFLGNPAERLQ